MLRLRPYKPADAGYLMKWLEDERTVEFWKADRFCWPLTAEQLADYCEDFTADPAAAAFTALDGAGNPAGHFSFRQIDWAGNRAHHGLYYRRSRLQREGLWKGDGPAGAAVCPAVPWP